MSESYTEINARKDYIQYRITQNLYYIISEVKAEPLLHYQRG
jgi:hypothetical protein